MNDEEQKNYLKKMTELKRRVIMKDKVIEAAGKAWHYLKDNGETSLLILPRKLKEKSEVVNQAVGWLAREDKIRYSEKNNKTFLSVAD